MKIGFCYDICEDYGFDSVSLSFCDFTTEAAVSYVKNILEGCGYTVQLIGNYKKLIYLLEHGQFNCDLIFSTAEGIGSRNREGWIPSLCEAFGIPFVGTDAYGLALTLDKVQTKLIARHLGIPTPDFYEVHHMEEWESAVSKLGFPMIVKPNAEGSSMGVSLVYNTQDLINRLQDLLSKYKQKVLCETYLSGQELTTSVYVKQGSPIVFGMAESRDSNHKTMEIYSSQTKRIYGCKKILPQISEEESRLLHTYSIKLFNYIGCQDYCRMDFRKGKDNVINLLEVTPLPALSDTASFTAGGILFGETAESILKTIIENACLRHGLFPKS